MRCEILFKFVLASGVYTFVCVYMFVCVCVSVSVCVFSLYGEIVVKLFEGAQTGLPMCVIGGLASPIKLSVR